MTELRVRANGNTSAEQALAVVVPTRSRPQNVMPIIDAWHATGAFDVARLVFAIDADDIRYDTYLAALKSQLGVTVYVLPEWQPMVPKLDRVALELAAEFKAVAFMGDDHIPRTQRWAHMLVERHLSQWSRPQIIYGQDGLQDQRLPTWWSMDGRIIKALGRMVPAPVQHLFCDNAVKELGDKSGVLTYDQRILIEHMHPYAGKSKPDDQYVRVNRPQQYQRDGDLFRAWVRDGLAADATIVRSIGG